MNGNPFDLQEELDVLKEYIITKQEDYQYLQAVQNDFSAERFQTALRKAGINLEISQEAPVSFSLCSIFDFKATQ